jgi:hypothetical protein
VPPDVTAAIFWLKNRRKEDWKDKHEIGGDPNTPIKHEHRGVGWMTEDQARVRGWAD